MDVSLNEMNISILYMSKIYLVLPIFLSSLFLDAQDIPKIVGDSMVYQNLVTFEKETESIYLQTSKDVYQAGEDLWFKAYVLSSNKHKPSLRSKILYLELIREENNDVVWKEKYEIIDGFVDGHIFLSDSFEKGTYKLLAFSSYSFYENQEDFYDFNTIQIILDSNDLSMPTKQENKKDSLDFQLFPEGGKLVSELANRVAFKATKSDGYPAEVSGVLLENGQRLLNFNSLHAGMGSFKFIPKAGKEYTVELTNDQNSGLVYKLPNIEDYGMTLHLLENNNDFIAFNVSQNPVTLSKKVYLRIQVNGITYSLAESSLAKSLVIKVPLEELPQGIAVATLFNESFEPICERLVYVNPERRLSIKTTLLSEVRYRTRDKVEIGIKVTDNKGEPVLAHLGISVHDWIYENRQNPKSIFTHYYLSSQLRGKIYDSNYYFNLENQNRLKAMDLLLLTQGWRSYFWRTNSIKKPSEPLVRDFIIGSASATGKNKGSSVEKIAAMAYAPGNKNNRDIFFLDSLGNFSVTPNHLRIGSKGFVFIKLMVPSESRYHFHVRDSMFEKIDKVYENIRFVENLASIDQSEPIEIEPFKNNSNIVQLEEVQVEGKKRKIKRNKYMSSLDSIAKLELTNDYICKHNYLNCPVCIGDEDNKKPTEGEIYQELQLWDENRKMYVKANEGPRPNQLFRNPSLAPYKYPKLTDADLMNLFKMVRIKGYYGHREFYQPRYDTEAYKNDFFPDNRNTLFWDPSVVTDKNGEARISFYCSDLSTLFIGTVEGVGIDEGFLGRETFEFLVEE